MKNILICILLPFLLAFGATPVYAVPALPHAFYGSVTINGTAAPDGSRVSATVDSGTIISTQNPVSTVAGSYGVDTPKLLVQGDDLSGATITFYVNGVSTGQTATFEAGGGPATLDLNVPATPPSLSTSAASSVTTSSATLNGTLSNLGTALSVSVSFQWGATEAYGNTIVLSVSQTGAFDATLSGLNPATTYHFRAAAVGDGTGYGTDRTFTTATPPSLPPPAPPSPVLPRGTTDVRGMVGDGCSFIEPVTAASDDELCTLTIPVGTVGLTEDLECLPEITMVTMEEPPPPPEDAHVIGLVYDFGPDGATFEEAIILTFTYDPDALPEGVSEEDLVIAYFVDGEWVELDECVIDTETNTITASVSHFTTFAVIGTPPTVVEEKPTVTPVKPELVVEKEEEPVEEAPELVVEKEEAPELVVEKEEEPVVEKDEVPAPAGVNWPVVGGIIGGVVLLVGWLIFFFWRRRAYN